ncbi:MAG TPA: TIGR03085 family metal-binding protein [Natronosporangium sp.]|nr:TIGR03085 family metal-binding protein [Natronosporangium sp.]
MNEIRRERAALCDLLATLGPDQPTLCTGWRTRDLAAHLLLRERRPLAAPGILLSSLAGYTARVQQRLASRPYPQLLAQLRRPPLLLRPARLDYAVNCLELFVHHEDVRRAQPDWQPRPLPAGLAPGLWRRVRTLARMRLRRFPATVTVLATGYGQIHTGAGGPMLTLTGDPGELALWLTGRPEAARVRLSGPDELVAQLTAVRFSV